MECHFTLDQIRQAVSGELSVGDGGLRQAGKRIPSGVAVELQLLKDGEVYWPVQASDNPRNDMVDAFSRGAIGIVSTESAFVPPPGCWCLRVNEPLAALWELARWNRNRFQGTVVAVSGSVGKTTAKHMIETVLGAQFSGTSSPHNYNHNVGLPLSMLAAIPKQRYAVYELAAKLSGEMSRLARLCRPRIGVMTRLGEALVEDGHNGGRPDHKLELLSELPSDGLAVLNGDDAELRARGSNLRSRTIWVGRSTQCDLFAASVSSYAGQLRFRVEDQKFQIPVWGRHHLPAALASIAVGREFGMTLPLIAEALENFESPPMQCQVFETQGITFINDAYSAHYTAMQAALVLLAEVDSPGRKIILCGDLSVPDGSSGSQLHRRLGEAIVTLCGADRIFACGRFVQEIAGGASEAGMPADHVVARANPEELLPYLKSDLRPGDVVLVKGSRHLKLDRLLLNLQKHLHQQDAAAQETPTHGVTGEVGFQSPRREHLSIPDKRNFIETIL